MFPVLLAALWSCGRPPTPPEPAPEARPNVLIIVWDTVRADRMSLYGHRRDTTPALARFAREATVYEQAWSPGTWTVPAHASLFTGLPIPTHGAHGGHRWLDDRHHTLAELLERDGYDTVALSANLYVGSVANLLQGFEEVHTTYPRKDRRRGRFVADALAATTAKLLPDDASTEISPAFQGNGVEKWDKAIYKDAAPVLADGLLRILDERGGDRPWLAYVNFMEAHTPRIPSAASREALLTEEERRQALRTDMSLFAENAWMVGQRAYTADELKAFGDVYDAALLDLDRATAALLDGLRDRGLLDDTVVILLSDHGESLGEHRRLEHRWAIHEPLLHVPLVIRYPRGGFGPRRVSEPVSTLDVFRTVLDLTGVEPPQVAGLASRDLRDPPREVVVAQLVHAHANQLRPIHRAYPDLDLSGFKRTYDAVRRGPLKLVLPSDGPPALYDLAADPGETRDLSADRPADVAELTRALDAWRQGLAPYVPSGQADRALTPEEEAQLRILGYVEGDEAAGDEAP